MISSVDSHDPRSTPNRDNILAFYDLMINQKKPLEAAANLFGTRT
jgi:hypothetical protein